MVNTLTDRSSVVTQALVDLLRAKYHSLKLKTEEDVYYGDQDRYPRFPAISVETGPQSRDLVATGLLQRVSFTSSILVYHGPVSTQSSIRRELDAYAETVVDILHSDRQLGGKLIHSHVIEIEPGFVRRGGALLEVHRVGWEGKSNAYMENS